MAKKNVLFPIDEDVHKRVKTFCALNDLTMGEFASEALLKLLESKGES